MSEFELQCQCVKLLEAFRTQNKILFYTAIPNSTFTNSWSQKIKNKRSGVRSGLCDLFIIFKDKQVFIELKTETGTLQPTQKEVIKHLCKTSQNAFIATSLFEFDILVRDLLKSSNFANYDYLKRNGRGARMLKKLLEVC